MPKSKRNKQVELSKARKHGMEGKKKLYEEIRSCVDSYANIFIFSVNDMRNSKIKSVREQWKHSRFFIGKNKVMALALGRIPEEEYRTNLHKIGERLKGERALLFSNQSAEEVLKWFNSYSEGDFARSGNRATETVVLQEGPLSQFPHNLEPYLRQLGLPTTLKKGVIHLIQDHTVCNEGDVLTPETAKILKLLGYEMAEFYIKIECVWSQDGSFKNLQSDSINKENINNSNSMDIPKNIDSAEEEEMEVTEDIDENNQEDEDIEDEEIPTLVEINKPNVDEQNSLPSVHKLESSTVKENKSDKDNISENIDENDDVVDEDETSKNIQLNSTTEKVSESSESSKDEILKKDESDNIINQSDSKCNALETHNDIVFDKCAMQSPLLSEKRPKFSPKVTRSVAKKGAKKPINEPLATKTPAKKATQKLTSETPVNEMDSVKITNFTGDSKSDAIKEGALKKHNTGESPMERQLRNRSIKIVKNKK